MAFVIGDRTPLLHYISLRQARPFDDLDVSSTPTFGWEQISLVDPLANRPDISLGCLDVCEMAKLFPSLIQALITANLNSLVIVVLNNDSLENNYLAKARYWAEYLAAIKVERCSILGICVGNDADYRVGYLPHHKVISKLGFSFWLDSQADAYHRRQLFDRLYHKICLNKDSQWPSPPTPSLSSIEFGGLTFKPKELIDILSTLGELQSHLDLNGILSTSITENHYPLVQLLEAEGLALDFTPPYHNKSSKVYYIPMLCEPCGQVLSPEQVKSGLYWNSTTISLVQQTQLILELLKDTYWPGEGSIHIWSNGFTLAMSDDPASEQVYIVSAANLQSNVQFKPLMHRLEKLRDMPKLHFVDRNQSQDMDLASFSSLNRQFSQQSSSEFSFELLPLLLRVAVLPGNHLGYLINKRYLLVASSTCIVPILYNRVRFPIANWSTTLYSCCSIDGSDFNPDHNYSIYILDEDFPAALPNTTLSAADFWMRVCYGRRGLPAHHFVSFARGKLIVTQTTPLDSHIVVHNNNFSEIASSKIFPKDLSMDAPFLHSPACGFCLESFCDVNKFTNIHLIITLLSEDTLPLIADQLHLSLHRLVSCIPVLTEIAPIFHWFLDNRSKYISVVPQFFGNSDFTVFDVEPAFVGRLWTFIQEQEDNQNKPSRKLEDARSSLSKRQKLSE